MTLAFDRHSVRWQALIPASVIILALVMPGWINVALEAPFRALAMLMQQVGWPVSWLAGEIVVGDIRVPWSADCAGMAYLVALPALAWFAAWRAGRPISLWRVVLLPLALALLVNLARVGSIIAYRLVFAPDVESAQLHYWLGFVWLVPALLVLLPERERSIHWLECLHLSAMLGLLSPNVTAPGGVVVLMAVAALAWRRTMAAGDAVPVWQWLVWGLAAVWITFSKMESLWLAWLLVCPWRGIDWRRTPYAVALLACTIPLVAMQVWSVALLVLPVVFMIVQWWRGSSEPALSSRQTVTAWGALAALSCAFLIPFLALGWASGTCVLWQPPASLHSAPTAQNCFELHMPLQPASMRVDWIGSMGGGRHHTVQVCMAYRGEYLYEAQPESPVFTDGRVLRREFFLFPDALVDHYGAYLRRTFWPGSDNGVHLIFSVAASTMSVENFDTECRMLAGRIREHCRPSPP